MTTSTTDLREHEAAGMRRRDRGLKVRLHMHAPLEHGADELAEDLLGEGGSLDGSRYGSRAISGLRYLERYSAA